MSGEVCLCRQGRLQCPSLSLRLRPRRSQPLCPHPLRPQAEQSNCPDRYEAATASGDNAALNHVISYQYSQMTDNAIMQPTTLFFCLALLNLFTASEVSSSSPSAKQKNVFKIIKAKLRLHLSCFRASDTHRWLRRLSWRGKLFAVVYKGCEPPPGRWETPECSLKQGDRKPESTTKIAKTTLVGSCNFKRHLTLQLLFVSLEQQKHSWLHQNCH